MAGPDCGECAIKMGLDGADWQAGDAGNLGELKLLQKAEKKDAPLTVRELRYAIPNDSHLLAGDEARLERTVAMRNVRGDVGYIDGRLRDSLPEAETVGSGVIADQVQGDPHQPGRDGAIASKAAARRPGPDEGVLGKSLGHIAVADRDEMETEDPLFIGGNDRVHIVQRCRRGLRDRRRLCSGEAVGSDGL